MKTFLAATVAAQSNEQFWTIFGIILGVMLVGVLLFVFGITGEGRKPKRAIVMCISGIALVVGSFFALPVLIK